MFFLILLGSALVLLNEPASAAAQGNSSDRGVGDLGGDKVVVHLFEWSWKDIAKECENLGKWGYWGVQVSPPQEDIKGNIWYTRYQPVFYKILSRSGTEAEFKEMVKTCADHGINIIVDAVINHMSKEDGGVGRGGTIFGSRCTYNDLYACENFHHDQCKGTCECNRTPRPCENCGDTRCNGNDPSKLYACDLIGLPDLDQSHWYVQQKLVDYLNHLVDLGVAGIRIDAAKHIDPSQMQVILSRVKAPGLHVNQEVILKDKGDCDCLNYTLFYGNGKVWEFKTPELFYDIFSQDNNMDKIRKMESSNQGCCGCVWAKSELAMTFVANHDLLTQDEHRPYTITIFNETRYRLAMITLLGHPYGQPNILSSLNFEPKKWNQFAPVVDVDNPVSPLKSPFDGNCGSWKDRPMKPYACEHRWPEVRNMVKWRRVAGNAPTLLFDVRNQNVLWTTRGRAFMAVNSGSARFSESVDTKGMPGGTYCNIVTQVRNGGASVEDCYPCTAACPDKVTVGSDGRVLVQLLGYNALAFHVQAMVPSSSSEDNTII